MYYFIDASFSCPLEKAATPSIAPMAGKFITIPLMIKPKWLPD
jgi:hypothetical protein